MFRKYEKTYRIGSTTSKRSLPKDDLKSLFAGRVTIEEKLDGANAGIVRHKRGFHLQKRSSLVGASEHDQFQFFLAWAHDKIYPALLDLPVGHIVYGELMRCIHTIEYTHLPDWFIVFDVWDGQRYIPRDWKEDFCEEYGFAIVPLLTEGYFDIKELGHLGVPPQCSAFGPIAEGAVIKKYHRRHKNFAKGKLINPIFHEKMDAKHWSTLPSKYNQVRS